MTNEDESVAAARPGSAMDLSRRMDRMEKNHDDLAREVSALVGTVARVESNQVHAEKLSQLQFDSLFSSIKSVGDKLDGFSGRFDRIMSGEQETPQTRDGRRIVDSYNIWRERTEGRLEKIESDDRAKKEVADALIASRSSTGVWVRSAVPWIIAGLSFLLAVTNTVVRFVPSGV